MDQDHGARDEGEGVEHEPVEVPLGHEGADVGQLADRLDDRGRQRQQLLVQLEARAALRTRRQQSWRARCTCRHPESSCKPDSETLASWWSGQAVLHCRRHHAGTRTPNLF